MAIYFFSEELTFRLKDKNKIRTWLGQSAQQEHKAIGDLNIIFCPDNYLHKINIQFLNHDTLTDVITFDYGNESMVSGEIFISLDRVKENALTANTTLKNELHRVIIHGLLHLCGYGDKTPLAKAQMTVKEDYYLSLRDF